MANDIHVWLPDDMAAALKARAEHEMRSVTNMACVLIQRGLAVPGNPLVAAEDRPRVGRPRTRSTLTPLVEDCVTTDEPGKAGGKR